MQTPSLRDESSSSPESESKDGTRSGDVRERDSTAAVVLRVTPGFDFALPMVPRLCPSSASDEAPDCG
ncbi:MAG: hypothetical protein KDA28_02535 [Phycisphaerales bacterium]|nr:hypothetical protein [Phycisphaerales bacterium]